MERIIHHLRDATRLVSVVKLLCWQHRRVCAADALVGPYSPHAADQSSPRFLQVHLRVSQSCLQVHLTTLSRASGAGGRSVILGSRRFRTRTQPHSSGSISSPFPMHCSLVNTPERCGTRTRRTRTRSLLLTPIQTVI